MTYKLELDKRIKSKLKKLEKLERALLFKLITKITEDPLKGKPLRYSLKGLRRVTFKHYRVIYKILEDEQSVFIVEFEHRGKVYRKG
jgi:mRNA interferase RelE/StbE